MSADPRSDFYRDVQATYGSFIGGDIAASAERNLRKWGIDPAQLTLLPQRGNNMKLYKYNDSLLIKVGSELERHQQTPLKSMAPVLQDLASATIGYDMGSAAISLSAMPYLNTKDVTPEHVQALCHELYTRHGVLFRDNKLENVALSEEGAPYVIDSGSLIEMAHLPRGEKPFFYPDLSGFNVASQQWNNAAQQHHFHWPAQSEVAQFQHAANLFKGSALSLEVR